MKDSLFLRYVCIFYYIKIPCKPITCRGFPLCFCHYTLIFILCLYTLLWLLADVSEDTAVNIEHVTVNGIRSLRSKEYCRTTEF